MQAFRILKKGPTITCRSFEKQLLAYYWAFVETKHLTMGLQITMQPELAFMNYVLSDPIRHKSEHGNTHSSNGSGIYVIRPQKTLKAQVTYMKAQMPMVLTLSTPLSVTWLAPMASWGVTYSQLAEKWEDLSQVCRCSYMIQMFLPKSEPL